MSKVRNTTWRVRLSTTALLSCTAAILGACDSGGDKTLTGPEAAERGEQLFTYNCGACHGIDGQGPSLAQIKSLADSERRDRMANHPVAGQIPQRLRAHELADLHEFFESD